MTADSPEFTEARKAFRRSPNLDTLDDGQYFAASIWFCKGYYTARVAGRADRIKELEGALRDAVRYIEATKESYWHAEFQAEIDSWRNLLLHPVEGPKASEGDER